MAFRSTLSCYGPDIARGFLFPGATISQGTLQLMLLDTCPSNDATTGGRLRDSAAFIQEWAIDGVSRQKRLRPLTPEASIARLFENTPIT